MSQRGEWLGHSWRYYCGFVKAHVAIDVETPEVVAAIVMGDRVGDSRMLIPTVHQVQQRPGRQYVRVLAILT